MAIPPANVAHNFRPLKNYLLTDYIPNGCDNNLYCHMERALSEYLANITYPNSTNKLTSANWHFIKAICLASAIFMIPNENHDIKFILKVTSITNAVIGIFNVIAYLSEESYINL